MTLLEVAIGMIILGLLVTALLPFYKIYRVEKVHMATTGNIADVRRALTQYALVNGGYPRPAQRNIVYTNANFGVEFSGAISNCVINDPNVCRLTGIADKAGPAGNDPVLRGDVPFSTLGLPYTSGVDGYGNRLTYSVSEYMTTGSAVTFLDSNGVIRVQDESGNSTWDALRNEVTNRAHFAIVSHGRNGAGAYTRSGTLRAACNTADANLGRDRENCDLDAIYTNNFVVYTRPDGVQDFNRVQSDVLAATYYDDYVSYSEVLVQGTWIRSGNSVATGPNFAPNSNWAIKVGDQDATDTIVPYYGGAANDPPRARLNVVGANKGLVANRALLNRICDTTTTACNQETHIGDLTVTNIPLNTFNPAIIGVDTGGTDGASFADGGGIVCGSQSAMRAIIASEEDCEDNDTITGNATLNASGGFKEQLTKGTGFGCPDLKFAQGVDASGNLICIDPP
jgi:type II secretory pathway pseudopilin PulG